MTGLTDRTLTEVSGLIAARRMARANATQRSLNAFSRLLNDTALVAAQAAEAEIRVGRPLHRVPVAVKDMVDVAGYPTTGSSRHDADRVAAEDSAAVARLRADGAVIVGKTHKHEIAYGVTTPQCRNPCVADHTPGGSSGGSAIFIATGSSFMALGTDTGGSIRTPAACRGVTGLKPTFGLCSRFGVMPLSPTLDHVGPLTRTAADAALCLQVLAGYDGRDPGSIQVPIPDYSTASGQDVAGLRIGIATGEIFAHVDAQVASAFATATDLLSSEGALIREVIIPRSQIRSDVGGAICVPEASAFHADSLRDERGLFADDVARLLRAGTQTPATRYIEALELLRQLRRDRTTVFDRVDVLLAPTIPTVAIPRRQETLSIGGSEETAAAAYVRLCVPASIVGLPVISASCGTSSDGLPIAFQVMSRPCSETTALGVCDAWQKMTDWDRHLPPAIA